MIRLKPLRCIKTDIDYRTGERSYYYAPQGSKRHIYHLTKIGRKWVCFVDGSYCGSDPSSIYFDSALMQMKIHYRTVYRKKIEEIVA